MTRTCAAGVDANLAELGFLEQPPEDVPHVALLQSAWRPPPAGDAQAARRQLEPNVLGVRLRRNAIADYVRHSFSCDFWGRPMVRVGDSNWR